MDTPYSEMGATLTCQIMDDWRTLIFTSSSLRCSYYLGDRAIPTAHRAGESERIEFVCLLNQLNEYADVTCACQPLYAIL